MIEVGDYIKVKKGLPANTRESLFRIYPKDKWPILVTTIHDCGARMNDSTCRQCPGSINNPDNCFGIYSNFCVEAIQREWDK